MKVTDEMVWTAYEALPAGVRDAISSGTIHDALQAALADVPEPGPVAVENFLKGKLESERADRAEAKLDKVRAWMQRDGFDGDYMELLAILDGEP